MEDIYPEEYEDEGVEEYEEPEELEEEEEEDDDLDEELGLELEEKERELEQMDLAESKGIVPRLDIYEKAALLGIRAKLIDSGAPSTIDAKELKQLGITSSLAIAEEELRRGKFPLLLKRKTDIGPEQTIRMSDIRYVAGR